MPAALLTRPTVLLNAASADRRPCVLPDDEQAGGTVAAALIEAGHRDRIGLIGRNRLKEADPEISLAAEARLQGIERALKAAGTRPLGQRLLPGLASRARLRGDAITAAQADPTELR